MAPWQVQHRLPCSLRNCGKNFLTQASQQPVANHLFKLIRALHIYNEQDKKETVDTLLMGGYRDNW